ncbi:hypothetical protein D3C80_1020160 [compost metagenome]
MTLPISNELLLIWVMPRTPLMRTVEGLALSPVSVVTADMPWPAEVITTEQSDTRHLRIVPPE